LSEHDELSSPEVWLIRHCAVIDGASGSEHREKQISVLDADAS
jgi:hypothetical protein